MEVALKRNWVLASEDLHAALVYALDDNDIVHVSWAIYQLMQRKDPRAVVPLPRFAAQNTSNELGALARLALHKIEHRSLEGIEDPDEQLLALIPTDEIMPRHSL